MYTIDAYTIRPETATLSPMPIKRDWMDDTWEAHAYKCFPLSLTNGLGWAISFPDDITFIWDGISDSTADHVKIISGEKWAYTSRGNATISFNTGIMFRTPENLTMLQMPAPNFFIEGAQCFTTLISTSFLKGEIPCALRITKANEEITIKAGTPVCSVFPISLTELNNSEMVMKPIEDLGPNFWMPPAYTEKIRELNMAGKWSNFYRDSIDHKGNSIGSHEVKALRLKVIDGPRACGE
jgi:hypothetical protein